MKRPRRGRKLLLAAIGVATVNYVACGDETVTTSGNLMAPPDAQTQDDADPPRNDANFLDVVANLIAPPLDSSQE